LQSFDILQDERDRLEVVLNDQSGQESELDSGSDSDPEEEKTPALVHMMEALLAEG
jgi:hypothetical protein